MSEEIDGITTRPAESKLTIHPIFYAIGFIAFFLAVGYALVYFIPVWNSNLFGAIIASCAFSASLFVVALLNANPDSDDGVISLTVYSALFIIVIGMLSINVSHEIVLPSAKSIIYNPITGENYENGLASGDNIYFFKEGEYKITKNVEGSLTFNFVTNRTDIVTANDIETVEIVIDYKWDVNFAEQHPVSDYALLTQELLKDYLANSYATTNSLILTDAVCKKLAESSHNSAECPLVITEVKF